MRKLFRFSFAACFFTVLCAQSPSFAFLTDQSNHVLTLSPSTSPTQNTAELRKAVSFLVNRPDKTTLWTMRLNPGNYVMSAQITLQGLQNTTLTSADLSQPAKLIKMPGWDSATSAEELLNFRMCRNVSLIGMQFYGQTTFAQNANPYWPDQGVYFGSCNVVKVDHNKFFNFGNAALRVATWERDPVKGVDSFKTMVSNNTFNNIYQTSTTVQDNVHGGTAMSTWVNNTFVNLRGAVKFASRTPGAGKIEFFNNLINGGDHFGLEINNYSNFNIRGNTLENIKGNAMNIYTGVLPGFPWGDNFTIANNTLNNVGRGIRFSHEPGSDGFQYVPQNLIIDNNTLIRVTDPTRGEPAIMVINGNVNGVKITNNKLSTIASKTYIVVSQGSTNVSVLSNLVDGVAYGPQQTLVSK
jgi:hypothetical protein